MARDITNIEDMTSNDQAPSREQAEEAVRTLIRWAGDNPEREGLIDTPARVTRAYEEFFKGYQQDPSKELAKTFEDIKGFEDMVLVRDIAFTSHCEHHMVPIIGTAHVAYWPNEKVVGISKLARIVDIHAKRLVSQESMTRDIVSVIDDTLAPRGVAVLIDANHQSLIIESRQRVFDNLYNAARHRQSHLINRHAPY